MGRKRAKKAVATQKRCMVAMVAFLLSFSTVAMAENYTCVDTNTSFYSTVITVSGSSIPISYNESCPGGCNNITGACNPDPYASSNSMILVILPLIAFILLYLSATRKEEDWAIHLLLMVAALAFLITPIGIMQASAAQENNSLLNNPLTALYTFMIVIIILVIAYYILKIIVKAVHAMSGGNV